MNIYKNIALSTLLAISAGAAHSQQGPSLDTATVQLLSLASPVLGLLDTVTVTLDSALPPVIADQALISTVLDLPSSLSGLIGVGAPLVSGVVFAGGLEGILLLSDGLPVVGDLHVADVLLGITSSLPDLEGL